MTGVAGAALVGAGAIAGLHVAAIRAAGLPLVGVLSSGPDRSRAAAESFAVDRAYSDLDELLADPRVDVVHVASPTGFHAEQVSRVIAAGKHVVCEKPSATNPSDAARLATEARQAGVVGSVAFTYRYQPVAREARALTQGGRLGPLVTVRGNYLQEWLFTAPETAWRLDPEISGPSRAFADIGSHLIDLIEFVSGDRVARVAAITRGIVEVGHNDPTLVDDAVSIALQTHTGAIGSLLVSQVAWGNGNALACELSGELGAITLDIEQTSDLRVAEAHATGPATVATVFPENGSSLAGFRPEGGMADYVNAFSAFVRDSYAAMATGEAPDGLPLLEDGARAALVGDAVLRSARTHVWVDVDQAGPSRRGAPGPLT